MLRFNNKIVKKAIQNHVLSYYNLEDLKSNLQAVNYGGNNTTYLQGLRLVEGGCFLVYYDSIREFFKDILQQTETESQKYSDDRLWAVYKHEIALNIEKILK